MKNIGFLVTVSTLLLTSCTQPSPKSNIVKQHASIIEAEEFHESQTLNETKVEPYVTNSNYQQTRVSTKNIEQIPSFQENDFHSLQTNSRKSIKKELEVGEGGSVKVNVESIPLHEFVDFIFSSVLKMNYTLDKSIEKMKQPITLNMAKPLPKKQVLEVVENILKNESVRLTQENETLFVSQYSKRKAEETLSDKYVVLGRELPTNMEDTQKVLVFTPFYYTNPIDIFQISTRLKINKVKMNFLNKNIAIFSGEAFDVKQMLELVKVIDSPSMEKKTPYVLELEYIDVEKFIERMKSIFESNSIPIANNIREVGMVLTPIEEINTLLVLSSKKSWIEMLEFWKNKLDRLSEVDNEHAQLYIYKVENRKADELAKVLQDVLSIAKSSEPKEWQKNFSENNQTTMASSRSEINIKSDLHTNSIMMNVTPAQYKKLLPTIKKLDTLPLQVAVEVILAEVTMTDTFNLGFEWSLLNNKAISGTPTQVSGAHALNIGGAAGITSNLFTSNLTSVINAFAEKKKLEILSRPRLVILNNQTGNINVGKQVPVVSSEASAADLPTSSSNSSILRNISYISTGMTVNLSPTINSNGTLTLTIGITLSEAQTNKTSKIDSPLIVNRSLSTSAVMQSGNSILLGGIISNNNSSGHGGVPFFQDIPYIGDIFKAKSKSNVKTELIIMIKPTILKNSKELHKETENFKLLLKNLKESVFF